MHKGPSVNTSSSFFCGPRKQVQTPPLPPLIFLKLILRFTQNPLPPLNFPQVKPQVLKLNFRFLNKQKFNNYTMMTFTPPLVKLNILK
jgi:hypothetical protein